MTDLELAAWEACGGNWPGYRGPWTMSEIQRRRGLERMAHRAALSGLSMQEACGGRATAARSWWYFPNGSRILITGTVTCPVTVTVCGAAWSDGDWFPGPIRGVDDWSKSPF